MTLCLSDLVVMINSGYINKYSITINIYRAKVIIIINFIPATTP